MPDKEISYDYIRGLVDGEGCFTFCSIKFYGVKKQLPAFVISMSERDENLIGLVKKKLKLRNRIYKYKKRTRIDSYNRMPMVTLIVRDIGQLKNIIVPVFYKKLYGNKGKQFEKWIDRIESDPLVPENYKLISILYKNGFYDKNFNNYD